MDATESATAIVQQQEQQQQEMPFLANATVYAIGEGGTDGTGWEPGCGKSSVNDTTKTTTTTIADEGDGEPVLLQPQSNASPSTEATGEAPAPAPVEEVIRSGEDSHFDSSLSGPTEPEPQPQPQLQLVLERPTVPQFTDYSGDGATAMVEAAPCGGDVKDQIERPAVAEAKRENGEGTQPNPAAERLLFITALASGGGAAAAAAAATLTTTTTTTTAKKCPFEIDEGAENHNTLATVVGDHGAITATATTIDDGPAAVGSVVPPQQVVYVCRSGGENAPATVRCSSDPSNSNVVRIQIIPDGGYAEDEHSQHTSGDVRGSGVPGGWRCTGSSGPVGSTGATSGFSVSSAAGVSPGSKVVTVVSFGGDASGGACGRGSVVGVGDGSASDSGGVQQQLQEQDIGQGPQGPEEDSHSGTAEPIPYATTVHCAGGVLHGGVVLDAGDARTALVGSPTGEVSPEETARMVQKKSMTLAAVDSPSTYVYYLGPRPPSTGDGRSSSSSRSSAGSGSSGQCSPSDMLDSGTCSDIEVTPPPLPKKMSQRLSKSTAPSSIPSAATVATVATAAAAVSSTTTAAAVLTSLAIKNGGAPGAVPAPPCDKTTTTTDAVINQQTGDKTLEFHHHHLEFHRLHHNQTHQQQQQQQHQRPHQQQLLLNDDDQDQHHRDEEPDRQNGKHQTHVDLTQNCFAARQQQQQQQQQAGSVIVSDSDGSESCLSCDSLNFEHLSSLQQPLAAIDGTPLQATVIGADLLDGETLTLEGAGDASSRDIEFERPKERRTAAGHRVPPFLAGNVCGLPDSLLAAIRESRPKVYCSTDEDQHQQQQEQKLEPVTDRNGGGVGGHERASMVEQLELLMPTTTTRSILMDKINSLEQSMQARFSVGDQPGDQPDASSNHQQQQHQHQHHHHLHHAINSDVAGRAQSSCSTAESVRSNHFESDKFYKFHIHEHVLDVAPGGTSSPETTPSVVDDDESFAGLKDLSNGTSTIRSNKGTVRGVKNRVRNGIATFLQMQQTGMKNYKDKEAGKVVVYSTSMGIVRETYTKCMNVKQILRTLLIKFEEKDIFMSNEYQQEIRERMQTDTISIPQVFVDGQHIGDAECIERLNESGELRKMLKPYKCLESPYMCKVCGGYRLLPCPSCGGSKKSIHRNHFTAEFIALKCMNCDEVGLVKCHNC